MYPREVTQREAYDKGIELALGVEAASKNLKEMKPDSRPEPVHKVYLRRPRPNSEAKDVTCHRCGTPGHLATVCRFQDRTCYKCGKKGHLAKVCRSQTKSQSPAGARSRRPPSQPVHRVGDDSEDDSDDSSQPVLTVRGPGDSSLPIKVHVVVDDCSLPMEVDTGASVSLISDMPGAEEMPYGKRV